MFSLIAIFLLVLLIVGGLVFSVMWFTGRWRQHDRLASMLPPLVALIGVLAACLVGWALAVALASP